MDDADGSFIPSMGFVYCQRQALNGSMETLSAGGYAGTEHIGPTACMMTLQGIDLTVANYFLPFIVPIPYFYELTKIFPTKSMYSTSFGKFSTGLNFLSMGPLLEIPRACAFDIKYDSYTTVERLCNCKPTSKGR